MDEIPAAVEAVLGGTIDGLTPIPGGSICRVYHVERSGRSWCLKTRTGAPADFFPSERDGIDALGAGGEVRVPEVVDCGASHILLEWLPPSGHGPDDAEQLGRQLAGLHSRAVAEFGFARDNYCGLTPQDNTRHTDGHVFFARCRLGVQGRMAHDAGLLPPRDRRRLERLADNLGRWIPIQPPSLIHGDLWSGNIHFSAHGPALIDPAAHHGWGEADLAMTRLFGAMAPSFYAAYNEVRPLEPGFDERAPLYNLYHLLNHLNLFGGGWLPRVRAVLDRYA